MEARKEELKRLADPEYKAFQEKLCPNITNILGIRIPKLRSMAKEIAKAEGKEYLEKIKVEYYEEVMLYGFVIGYTNMELKERLSYIQKYVTLIDNWATCDCPCSSFKFVKENPEEIWEFLKPYLSSTKEFEARFGVIMLLDYYLEDQYIDEVLFALEEVGAEGYYAKMAVAWTLSVTLVKYFDKTVKFMENANLDDFTYNKAIQKALESYRITEEKKEFLRKKKRK